MTHALRRAVLTLFLVIAPPTTSMGGPITYHIQNYAPLQTDVFQNVWTLSGTITTDGNLGPLTSDDIISWQYTIHGGHLTDKESSPGLRVAATGLYASSSQLMLLPPAPHGFSTFGLYAAPPNANAFLEYDISYGGSGGRTLFEDYTADAPSQTGIESYWFDFAKYPPGLDLIGLPMIIAQVPEPGSLTLVCLGSAFLAAALWAQRYRRVASSYQASPSLNS